MRGAPGIPTPGLRDTLGQNWKLSRRTIVSLAYYQHRAGNGNIQLVGDDAVASGNEVVSRNGPNRPSVTGTLQLGSGHWFSMYHAPAAPVGSGPCDILSYYTLNAIWRRALTKTEEN